MNVQFFKIMNYTFYIECLTLIGNHICQWMHYNPLDTDYIIVIKKKYY